jgi:hypothetical protein
MLNWFIEYNEDRARRFQRSLLWIGCPYSEEMLNRSILLFEDEQTKPEIDGDTIIFPLKEPAPGDTSSISEILADIRNVIGAFSSSASS